MHICFPQFTDERIGIRDSEDTYQLRVGDAIPLLRQMLNRIDDIADRLFSEGRIANEDLSQITETNGLTQQADALIKIVLTRRCARKFMQLVAELEPGLKGIFQHSERIEKHSQDIDNKPLEGNDGNIRMIKLMQVLHCGIRTHLNVFL